MVQPEVIAVILDLVNSRQLANRRLAQFETERSIEIVNSHVAAVQPLAPTVGDEFQGVYGSVGDALHATLLVRLAIPAGIDCRFGLGGGPVWPIGDGAAGEIQDGPGWWRAREAIDQAHKRADVRTPTLRTWYLADRDPGPERPGLAEQSLINSYLLARDHLIGGMSDRARRITLGVMLGRSQAQIAEDEGITQSAVSQSLKKSGGAVLVAGLHELTIGTE
ncbi:SatD family protein [Leifsonia kafniensis]|uniref:SatD family protein n=1 Tax=Leifsonia kafniensis TaxID=475957 RepID=A0ABP7K8T9_9MICO